MVTKNNLTMPCHKVYLNLPWQIPRELQSLGILNVTITKIYWTYTNKLVRICFYSKDPDPSYNKQPTPRKLNIPIRSESKTFALLYQHLAYYAVTHHDSILEELLSYMPTLLPDLQPSLPNTQKDLFCCSTISSPSS